MKLTFCWLRAFVHGRVCRCCGLCPAPARRALARAAAALGLQQQVAAGGSAAAATAAGAGGALGAAAAAVVLVATAVVAAVGVMAVMPWVVPCPRCAPSIINGLRGSGG